MNSIYLNDKIPHQLREKRLKVSKACFTCRVKKIKCDGLQPCMQCNARRRPCSFSKDGSLDQAQQLSDIHSTETISCTEEERPFKRRSLARSDSSLIAHQQTSFIEARSKEQKELYTTSQKLEKLSMMRPGEGKEGSWLVDINLLFNGVEDNSNINQQLLHHQSPIPINTHLLNLYFKHRYTVFPILPKSIFYRLLDNHDKFINPLLLYSIYSHSAHFSNEDASEADRYYKRAQELLDGYIDTPSLSTVVALCLFSLFESSRYGLGPHASTNRAQIYSDMACRMCYDLKLHKRYSFHNTGATPDDIELRKRVYWVCYCLDKVHSIVNTRPFLLSSKKTDLDFPMVLRTDDPSEFVINSCFVEHIKLMQISERILRLDLPDYQTNMMRSPDRDQLVLDLDDQLKLWLRSLPEQLQWTPLNTDTHIVPTQPPANALVAHLHLIFNFVEISMLHPFASTALSSSPTSIIIQQRCSSVATNLTQLICAMVDQPNYIMSFTLVAEAIMTAVRVHIMDCADEKLSRARHSRFMFQRSIRSLRSVLHRRIIDRIQEYTDTIERALADANTGNSNNRNSTPKLHVLSAIIPKNTTSAPTHNTATQPMESQCGMDDRWPAKHNNSTNNGGQFSYGLVSPASSTASAPAEKSTMSRDDELNRPQSNLAQSSVYPPSTESTTTTSTPIPNNNTNYHNTVTTSTTSVPLIDPYSRVASFTIPATPSPAFSPVRIYDRFSRQQEQMEMYSNMWSRSVIDTDIHYISSSSENLNSPFVNTTQQHADATASIKVTEAPEDPMKTAETSNTVSNTDIYSSFWQQSTQLQPTIKKKEESPALFTPRFGLGVYASAQQHHTDVIRQHMPGIKSNNRPVLLNHHGQVVVNNNIQP